MGPDPVPGGENLFCFNFGSGSFLDEDFRKAELSKEYIPFMMFVFAECLVERAILVVSGLELKRIGIGPAVMGWWSMSTLRV